MFKGKEDAVSTDVVTVKQQADINIFTVASGLLYEVTLNFTAGVYLQLIQPCSASSAS